MNMKKIFRIIFFAVLSILALGFILMVLMFNGGLLGTIRSFVPQPDWNGRRVASARNNAMEKIDLKFKIIENKMDFREGVSYVHDYCVKGDHSWKRNDPFAYECTLNVARYYAFNDDFRAELVKLETVFNSEGWSNDGKSISKMLKTYYDDKRNTNYAKTGLVSSLPSLDFDYYKVNIMYAQQETPLSEIQYLQSNLDGISYNEVYSSSSAYKLEDVFSSVMRDSKYLLIILIKQNYFSN